jgi:hypothetical protein
MNMTPSPRLISFLLEYLNNLVHAAEVDIAEELLQRVKNPRFPEFEAFFGVSFNPCIVGPKFVCHAVQFSSGVHPTSYPKGTGWGSKAGGA